MIPRAHANQLKRGDGKNTGLGERGLQSASGNAGKVEQRRGEETKIGNGGKAKRKQGQQRIRRRGMQSEKTEGQ